MRMWQTIRADTLDWHSHDAAYAALVLAGSYEEAGDHGRFQVEAGDVLCHDRFEGHVDRFPASNAVVLNLPLQIGCWFTPGAAKVADPDLIVSAAERSHTEAVDLLFSMIREQRSSHMDWPDALAAALIQDPCLMVSQWAEQQRLAPWTVSRGFKHVFGISPEAFRARRRARHAWKVIQTTTEPLVQVAFRLGFADQSHMSRSVKQMTGMEPKAWRVSANRFKTAGTSQV
jgi:AraC-like DNA-binding protein